MKRIVVLATAVASALSLAGCQTQEDRTVGGAAIGALTGGVLGAAVSGGRPGGAIVGAVTGGAVGAAIGANTPAQPAPPPPRCVRIRYDYQGNPYCMRYAPAY
jgi:osmotically inducible lipoprotein OsmB